MDQEYSCSAESGVQGTGHQGNIVCCFPAEIGVGEGGVEEPLVILESYVTRGLEHLVSLVSVLWPVGHRCPVKM